MADNNDKPKGREVGDPIWVESCMSREEWKSHYRKNKGKTSSLPEPPVWNEKDYGGGKWRAGMGYSLSSNEIINISNNLDYLRTLVDTKHLV